MNELLVVLLKIGFLISAIVLFVAYVANFFIMYSNVREGEIFTYINVLPVLDSRIFNIKGEAARKRNLKIYFFILLWFILFFASKYLGVIDV